MDDRCRYTVGQGVGEAVGQLDIWRKMAKRQAAALSAAAAAADAIIIIWERLDADTRARLDVNLGLRERIRAITNYYGLLPPV